jgi:hypothetical protein
LVMRVIVYVAACAGQNACDKTKASANKLDRRGSLKERAKSSLGAGSP